MEETQAVEQEVPAEQTAPEQVETASPVAEEVSPEETKAEEKKTFTQEELDAAIGKRLAREQRKWEREQQQRLSEAQRSAPAVNLDPSQFESTEQYAEALALKKAEELVAARDRQRQQAEVIESYHEKEEEARNKYDDFQEVAYNPKLPITDVMAEAIRTADVGPEIAYYLGMNPKEADRISRLSPFMQVKEIGKLEVKVSAEPPVKKTTNAPAPIKPVTPQHSIKQLDTTNPDSLKQLGTSEWIRRDRERRLKELQNR